MKNPLHLLAFSGLLAVTAFAEKIDLGSGKALLLTVPASWTGSDLPAQSPGMPMVGQNVRYVTKSGSNDALLITILPVLDDAMGDPDNLKAMVEVATQQFVAGSVEGKADLKEVKIPGASPGAFDKTSANPFEPYAIHTQPRSADQAEASLLRGIGPIANENTRLAYNIAILNKKVGWNIPLNVDNLTDQRDFIVNSTHPARWRR